MHSIPVLPGVDWIARVSTRRRPEHAGYYAFFASHTGGITTDPALMQVPVDDHLVHRGDGVFETLKCVDGGIYLLREHLDRLFQSAAAIGLAPKWTRDDIASIAIETLRAGGRHDALLRILLSRGPGSLGVNPYDCPEPGLYVLAHELKPSFMDAHPGGARAARSRIPPKAGVFATIKTCNYLPNAMMKKEAVDNGVDFTLSFDEEGFLAEGATENAGIVTRRGELVIPRAGRILQGTTMRRTFEIAADLVEDGTLLALSSAPIREDDVRAATEVLIFGTTPDVTSVIEYNGQPVGAGAPGPVGARLRAMLETDIRTRHASRTLVWP